MSVAYCMGFWGAFRNENIENNPQRKFPTIYDIAIAILYMVYLAI